MFKECSSALLAAGIFGGSILNVNRSTRKCDVLVLGGGWAGLLAARELHRFDPNLRVVVLERDSEASAGGLLRSEIVDGFTFDCGGPHILFSKYPETLLEVSEILGTNLVRRKRRNFVLFEDRFVPYPFENGMYVLSEESRKRLGQGLLAANAKLAENAGWQPRTFRDWIFGLFGDPIAREYLEPYNEKIWKRELDRLSADWVFTPGRVPTPSPSEIARAMAGHESIGYREQAEFLYPRTGGISSLYRALQKLVVETGAELSYGTGVHRVERISDRWVVNGTTSAPILVSTIPLPELLRMLRGIPRLDSWIATFDYNRVLVVGVALTKPTPDQTAVYVPRPDVNFHRYTWMSYLTPSSDENSNLIAEVTIPCQTVPDLDTEVRRVVDGLVKVGVVSSKSELLFTRSWLNEYGYPVYTHDHRLATNTVLANLRASGLYSVGRWGSWEYWNTDMVLRAVRATISAIFAESRL